MEADQQRAFPRFEFSRYEDVDTDRVMVDSFVAGGVDGEGIKLCRRGCYSGWDKHGCI